MLYAGWFTLLPLTLVVGTPLPRKLHVHDRRDSVPQGFTLLATPSPDTVLNLRIALVQSNPAGLIDQLYAVSTPSNASYGQFLSKQDAAAFAAPSPDSLSAVTSWLQSNGITPTPMTPAGDWLAFQVPVNKANAMLDAEFSFFTHMSSGHQSLRTLSYSIPTEMQGIIDFIFPTTSFTKSSASRRPAKSKHGAPPGSGSTNQSCATTITPSCLQSLYGIPTTPATQSSNQLLVTGYDDQFANQNDLQTFLQATRPDLSRSTQFQLQTLDGGQNLQVAADAGDEANLDIQYTTGLATGVPITFLSVGEDNSDDLSGFLDTINFLLAEDSPPQTMTTSYGFDESDLPFKLANNLCNAYAQLGARGVSIMFASGDGGVSGSQAANCTTFIPTFPATCPFITAVGSTTGISPETAASFSAGGFSNYFAQPSFQASAVSPYLSFLGQTNKGLFNTSGRGYPDVSTQGVNFSIELDGETVGVDGTSCSSPTFASVVALLNDRRVAQGGKPLGFLNPWLYGSAASALSDVTQGSNPGCGTQGFPATTNWDAVTGLGTPNFPALLKAAGVS
ncbi:family S53 protease-like protein [Amylocystis lapponica]|nr:family S53 protease-like protein [Amylocystis lapponica]